MQREEPSVNMPGGFKNNRRDGNANSTSSDPNNPVPASTMRVASSSLHGQSYQVAGPTIGGTPTPYDSKNIEIAKEHLAQSLNCGDKDASKNTSGHAGKSSLADNIIQGASTAATGAASAGASVIAAARKLISTDDGDEITEHGVATPQKDQHGLEFSQQKKVNPADRPPVKIPIHAMKPSDKATYGDLDSPGAHSMPGPLSDRAKVGTPPVVDTNAAKTIADPFGPLNVANWNDGKRHDDVSTPTSEDFESYLDAKPLHHAPIPSSSASSHAGAFRSSATHGLSPLKNEAAYVASDPSRNLLPDNRPTVITSRNVAPVAPTAVKPSVNHSAALAAAGAVGAGIAATSLHHDDLAPASYPVSQTTTSTTVPAAQAPQIKKIPIAQPPAPEKRIPIAQPPSDVKRVLISQPPSQAQQHSVYTTTSQQVPMSNAATSHTSAVPSAAAATEASVLSAKQDYTNEHTPIVSSTTTHTSAPVESPPLSEKITAPIAATTAAVTGAAAGTAAYLSAKKEGVKDSISGSIHTTHTIVDTPTAHHHDTELDTELASGAHRNAPAVHSTHTVPFGEKVTTTKSFRDPPITHTTSTMGPMAEPDPMPHNTVPVVSKASAPVAQKLTTTTTHVPVAEKATAEHHLPSAKIAVPLTAAVIGTTAYMSQKEEAERESMLHHDAPVVNATTHTTVPGSHTTTSVPVAHTTTAGHHGASEYGPANSKDLHFEDPSKTRPLGAPIAAIAATTAAAIGAKEVIKEAKTATSHTTHTDPAAHVESIKPVVVPRPVVPTAANVKSTTTTTTHKAAPLAAAAAAPMAVSANRNTTSTTSNNAPAPVSNTNTSSSYTTANTNTTPGANTITSSTVRRSSAAEIDSADKIAAAIPATYKGPIPTVNPGEEVIWVKTVTTTDFYDDEAAGIVDRNGDVVSTQQD
ncbi:hypothetical protein BGZ74_001295, partial [Mortierella antarctica]